jgi:hypothetical protein
MEIEEKKEREEEEKEKEEGIEGERLSFREKWHV